MTNAESSQPTPDPSLEESFRRASELRRAGDLDGAGALYQQILAAAPTHADANHNMGALAVQVEQPAAGLAYFIAALDADPARGQFWLSYIDALVRSGELDTAGEILALARQHGLEGSTVDTLAGQLDSAQRGGGPASAVTHGARPASRKVGSKREKSAIQKSARAGGQAKTRGDPAQRDVDALLALFAQVPST